MTNEARLACQRAKGQMQGRTPEEIIRDVLEHQVDPSVVEEAAVQANIGLTRKMLKLGWIRCPHCGGDDLVWACCGKRI